MGMGKRMVNRITAVVLAGMLAFSGAGMPVRAEEVAASNVPVVDTVSRHIYANGLPIVLESAGESQGAVLTMIKYYDGEGAVPLDLDPDTDGVQTQANLSAYTVFGGGTADIDGGTSVTMTGGAVMAIYGGGASDTTVGSSTIEITGGTVGSSVCAGSHNGTADNTYGVTGQKNGFIYIGAPGVVNANSFDNVFYKLDGQAWTVKGNVTAPSNCSISIAENEVLKIAYGNVLSLPSGAGLNNSGVVTIENESCLIGDGNVYGIGEFYLNQVTEDMITVPVDLEYTGEDLTELAMSQIGCVAPNEGFTIMNAKFAYNISNWEMSIAPNMVKDAGDYVVTYSDGTQSVSKLFSVIIREKEKTVITNAKTYATSYVYSGEAIPFPKATDFTVSAGAGEISFEWYDKNGLKLEKAPVMAGNYTLRIVVAESDILAANALNVDVVIRKAGMPKELPAFAMTVTNDVTTVSEVALPDNWTWDSTSAKMAIPSGGRVEATANYVGSDAANYQNTTAQIIIRRDACTLVQVEKVAPTATTSGREAYWTCTVCGKNFADAEGTTEISDLTVLDIPALGAPAKGTMISDEDGHVTYRVTKAGLTGGTVEYVMSTNKKLKKAIIQDVVTIDGITYQITSIAKDAFKNSSITSVVIGKNVKTIGANAFYGCKKLAKVTIGNVVTAIGSKAFYKCVALTELTIPSKVKSIGANAFNGCKKLKTITIKTTKLTKKNIGKNAFKGVYSKATVKVPKKKYKTYVNILKTKGFGKKVKYKKF